MLINVKVQRFVRLSTGKNGVEGYIDNQPEQPVTFYAGGKRRV